MRINDNTQVKTRQTTARTSEYLCARVFSLRKRVISRLFLLQIMTATHTQHQSSNRIRVNRPAEVVRWPDSVCQPPGPRGRVGPGPCQIL